MATRQAKKTEKKTFYCRAVGLKHWKANIGGKEYVIKPGEEFEVVAEAHFEALSHPYVGAIQRAEGE